MVGLHKASRKQQFAGADGADNSKGSVFDMLNVIPSFTEHRTVMLNVMPSFTELDICNILGGCFLIAEFDPTIKVDI